jgi:uncharacterized protein
MSIEVFKKLIDRTMYSSIQNRILIIFHGGEPTLVPVTWYIEAVNYANSLAKKVNKKVSFALQSNVLAMNPEKLAVFNELEINISVSVDGPIVINGTTLRGQDDLTVRNIRKLKEMGLNVGVLATINPVNYDRFHLIMDWLYNELNIKSLKANVMYAVGAGYNFNDLSDDQIYQAQESILNYMLETGGNAVIETNLCLEIKRFIEEDQLINKMSLCDDRVCGAGKRVFGVNLMGELLPCGRFEWNDNIYNLGDLDDVRDMSSINRFKSTVDEFHNLNPEVWNDCSACEAKKTCRYSCQAFILRSKSKRNVECLSMKRKYKFFLKNRKALEELYNNINNRQFSAGQEENRYITELTH